jgi:arsenite methyltransferase
MIEINQIDKRYSLLAESDCCLSCGGAINYASAKPGEICVDLGSGRGNDVLRLAQEVGSSGFVYGIDISDGMLNKARKNAEKFKVTNVEFLKSDLQTIALHENSIDLVISNCTINHALDKTKVWNEIYRILKKGGRFVISDIYSLQPVPEEFRNDPVAISECWAGSVTREEYFKTLTLTGFTEVNIIEESKPYAKGKIEVASITITGMKKSSCCCCS